MSDYRPLSLAFVLTAIFLSAIFIFYRSTPVTQPPPMAITPTQIPTPALSDSWQTYRNDTYGFEIKSPPGAYFGPSDAGKSLFYLYNFSPMFEVDVYDKVTTSQTVPDPDFEEKCGSRYADAILENKIITINSQKVRKIVQKEGVLYVTNLCLLGSKDNLIVIKTTFNKIVPPVLVDKIINSFVVLP